MKTEVSHIIKLQDLQRKAYAAKDTLKDWITELHQYYKMDSSGFNNVFEDINKAANNLEECLKLCLADEVIAEMTEETK